MRRYLLGVVMAAALVLPAAPAAAGGWWSGASVNNGSLVAGETISVRVEAYFTTQAQADAAQTTPYYAYLVRGYDKQLLRRAMTKGEPKRWWALGGDATLIQVGTVTLGRMRTNIGHARVSLTVPRTVDPGQYHLMLCTDGCVEPFGHAIPTPVEVFQTAAAVRQDRRVEQLSRQVRELDRELSSARNAGAVGLRRLQLSLEALQGRLNDATERTETAEAEAAEAQAASNLLAARVGELEEQQQSAATTARRVGAAVLLVLAAAAGAWFVRRRRRVDGASEDRPARDDTGWERPDRLVGSGRR